MKTKHIRTKLQNLTRKVALTVCLAAVTGTTQASTDYAPAIWRAPCNATYYTTGYGHKFHVVHDMEGYYAASISMYCSCSYTAAGMHYWVNGKTDTSTDAPAGQITQTTREAYYAWHAVCWNRYSTGTEHEGFASNPAWWTSELYNASSLLTRHLADKFGYAKDRNHIVGHGEKSNAAWCAWAEANFGIDAHCNSHTDPGPYWDWSKYIGLVNGGSKTAVIKDNTAATFVGTWTTGSSSTDKYGSDYRYHSTAAVSEPAEWTTSLNTSASWNVRAWWPQGSNRSATAPYIVTHSGGTATVNKNQQANGGSWQLLGTWSMSSGKVQLSCWTATGYIVVADAIKWD